MYVHLVRGNRDLFVTALGGSSRAASGRPEAVADDERGKEVRLADSTCEAGEQSGASRGGAGGGKQWDQEDCEPPAGGGDRPCARSRPHRWRAVAEGEARRPDRRDRAGAERRR